MRGFRGVRAPRRAPLRRHPRRPPMLPHAAALAVAMPAPAPRTAAGRAARGAPLPPQPGIFDPRAGWGRPIRRRPAVAAALCRPAPLLPPRGAPHRRRHRPVARRAPPALGRAANARPGEASRPPPHRPYSGANVAGRTPAPLRTAPRVWRRPFTAASLVPNPQQRAVQPPAAAPHAPSTPAAVPAGRLAPCKPPLFAYPCPLPHPRMCGGRAGAAACTSLTRVAALPFRRPSSSRLLKGGSPAGLSRAAVGPPAHIAWDAARTPAAHCASGSLRLRKRFGTFDKGWAWHPSQRGVRLGNDRGARAACRRPRAVLLGGIVSCGALVRAEQQVRTLRVQGGLQRAFHGLSPWACRRAGGAAVGGPESAPTRAGLKLSQPAARAIKAPARRWPLSAGAPSPGPTQVCGATESGPGRVDGGSCCEWSRVQQATSCAAGSHTPMRCCVQSRAAFCVPTTYDTAHLSRSNNVISLRSQNLTSIRTKGQHDALRTP
jgi:hypothetical protein